MKRKRKQTVLLVLFGLLLLVGLSFGARFLISSFFHQSPKSHLVKMLSSSDKEVLASSDYLMSGDVAFNIPVNFNDIVTFKKNSSFEANVSVSGQLQVKDLTVNGEKVRGTPIGLQATAGQGISIGTGALPTISNTGVTSFLGKTGDVSVVTGNGLSLSGTTLTNSDTGSSQKIFSTIQANGMNLSASTNTSVLQILSGSGIGITADSSTNTITLANTLASNLNPNGIVYASTSSSLTSLTPGQSGYILSSSGTNTAPEWIAPTTIFSGTVGFNNVVTGLNIGQTMTVGNGSILGYVGSGILNANQLLGKNWASPGPIGTSSASTGTFTALSAATINGLQVSSTGGNTLTIAGNKTISFSNTLAFLGSDGTSFILPAFSDTLLGRTSSDSLMNKTIAAGLNTITGLTNANFSGSAGIANANLANSSITISAGSGLSGGGVVSLGSSVSLTNTGVLSLLGTANQVVLAGSSGNLTLSLPQNIAATSSPTFSTVTLTNVTSSIGGIIYSSSTGLGVSSVGSSGQCLQSGGSLSPMWGVCGANNWQENGGALSPKTVSDDFLLGGNATSSAKFQISGSTGSLSTAGNITLTSANTTIGEAVSGLWTLTGNTYSYRRQVTISNTGGQMMPIYTQVAFSPTGADLSDLCTNTLSNNNDIRVAYTFVTEVPVNITRNCNSSLTVNFELQKALSSGQSDIYYVYYHNASLAQSQTGYSYANTQVDSMDTASSWTSSDSSNASVSQETTIKQEGTGSLKIVESAEASGNVGTWTTTGQGQLPTANNYPGTTSITLSGTTYFYLVMGQTSAVYKAQLDSTGNVGVWSTTNQGQLGISTNNGNYSFIAATNGTNYIYSVAAGFVSRAQLDGSGNVGSWSTAGQAQSPIGTDPGMTSATINGTTYVYRVGRNSNVSTVYKATIDSSGNVGTWATTNQAQMPLLGLYGFPVDVTTIGGTTYMYLIGGFNGVGSAQSTVYRSQLDSSGNILSWSTTGQGQLPTKQYYSGSSGVVLNGTTYIYVFGGNSFDGVSYSVSSTVYKAQVDTSGNIGTWSSLNQTPLPQGIQSIFGGGILTSSVGGTNYFYVIGGYNAVSLSTVYRAPLVAPVNTISRSISSLDLSKRGGIQFSLYASRTGGSYLTADISNDAGTTWQSYPVTVNTANTWQTVTLDITGLSTTQRNTISQVRFRITDPTVAATVYIDDIESLVSPYLGSAPTFTNAQASANGILSNLSLNAQGYGSILNLNYDPTNGLAGTGGLALYNGSSTKLFNIDGSGNVRISGGGLCVKSDQSTCNGGVTLTPGTIYANAQSISAADYAENYVSSQTLESGDVVALANDGNNAAVVKSTNPYQANAIGIVSTSPGITINSDAQKDMTHPNVYPIALSGRVPLKVSTENGSISVGDSLTSSSIPGVAMKATKGGQVLAKALEEYTSSNTSSIGKIMVYVNVTYADFSSNIQSDLQSQLSSLSSQMKSLVNLPQSISASASSVSIDSLAVTGRSTFADMGITGTITMGLLSIEGMHAGNDGVTATINTLSAPLKLQSLGLNGIDFENGKVTIDTAGNMVVSGDLSVSTMHAKKISVSDIGSDASVGSVVIPPGITQVDISSTALTASSRIFATPEDVPVGVSTTKIDGKTILIKINQAQSTTTKVNWWIIN